MRQIKFITLVAWLITAPMIYVITMLIFYPPESAEQKKPETREDLTPMELTYVEGYEDGFNKAADTMAKIIQSANRIDTMTILRFQKMKDTLTFELSAKILRDNKTKQTKK